LFSVKTLLNGFDKKKTGKIEKEKFVKVLRAVGIHPNISELKNYSNEEGQVDYNSFLAAYKAN
jgi:Ca2+-binding EF-hand superfamily protein